tara:strand:+ start:45 stop:221 length:177 start_codon:yes stop_codon:yes gene_type:complete
MEFSKNTSKGSSKSLLFKILLVLTIFILAIVLLGKIELPSPNKHIEKIIPNETIKIVK